ncbi:hypothetical protein SISSUDRAFT_994925 [Sistotremastrum suecicum HHB10207 ss-3]|uniref:Uncharacterized protein n=1 Tax=Sistotremastrum suecicum HHB10207 ss-3 TaxID=1314776 RepID=A0A165WVY2_9AGAM|nr:hypothetical protein SISSUDRAFT_994925 [Sistotremastrum suecicum HHB10207 ss-3]
MMMTDALFSAPRLRFSQKQISAVLDYAKQMGAKNVPSKDALKQFRKKCIEKLGDPTKKVRFASGNIAFVNDMHVAAARAYGNPQIRPKMRCLPEDTKEHIVGENAEHGKRPVREACHAAEWLNGGPKHALTPMLRVGQKDFYVNELLRTDTGLFFIPERFFERRESGILHKWSRGHSVTSTEVFNLVLLQSFGTYIVQGGAHGVSRAQRCLCRKL